MSKHCEKAKTGKGRLFFRDFWTRREIGPQLKVCSREKGSYEAVEN